jgi:hypothetical protein
VIVVAQRKQGEPKSQIVTGMNALGRCYVQKRR